MITDPTLTLCQAQTLDTVWLASLQTIYQSSFPPSERIPLDDLLREIAGGTYHLFLAHRAGRLAGFAISMPLPSPQTRLLGYLAVEPACRGAGVGQHLLRHLAETYSKAGSLRGLWIEVEADTCADAMERALRRRRIAFYQRLGAILLEEVPRYVLPNRTGGDPLELRLLWLPLDGSASAPAGARLREQIAQLYTGFYGLSDHHPLARACLETLAG